VTGEKVVVTNLLFILSNPFIDLKCCFSFENSLVKNYETKFLNSF